MMMTTCLFIFGTRPEAIKCAPLILELQKDPSYSVKICVTAQHRSMLDDVLLFFSITPDWDLEIMQEGASLLDVSQRCMTSF